MGTVHVVHGSGTLRVVSKEHFGWSHTLVSVASLRSAAAAGDPQAASLLARLALEPHGGRGPCQGSGRVNWTANRPPSSFNFP